MLIREIDTFSELLTVEELQKEIWGVEDREVLPALAMIPVTKIGGLLLGAFDGEQMIGFAFAFPGFEKSCRILHSDMLAVKPAYRSHGVGYQLKLAQRDWALEQGVNTITWTFDPLQSLNARLNFGKLGVISDRYYTNFYGETTSFLHSTGTDRLWVSWILDSERVKERITAGPATGTVPLTESSSVVTLNYSHEPIERSAAESTTKLSIDVPFDINGLVRDNPELGQRWRLATRNAFNKALADGFFVEDFYVVKNGSLSFGRYVLTKTTNIC